ncbi:MAG: helix-turn-helix domain-containing protein [Halobellus sp.]
MRQATIHLSDAELAALGIGELVSLFRDAGLRRVSELQCRGSGCLLVVGVDEAVDEERLAARSDVEWWERIDGGGSVTYLCKVAVPEVGEAVDPYHETEVAQRELDPTEKGLDVTILGSHEALGERVREYEAAGADVLLRAMSDYEGPDDPLDATTPRQREVLKTAFDLGYFDVPRAATTEEVGEALDLDPSTVREHLQRAQRNVFAALLADER